MGKGAAKKAIKGELHQLFQELVALVPVKRNQIPESMTILKSHMFLVNKYLANGDFNQCKTRLVTDGRDQDPKIYPEKSSPTVAIHSVFTVLGLACEKYWWIVIKINIKGAFMQTPMGQPTFIQLDPKVTQYVKELYPVLNKFISTDGCIYTVLLKAMYGCVQASALWYALIRREIEKIGYAVSETNKFVFVKQVGDSLFTLLLCVDDILAVVDTEEVE